MKFTIFCAMILATSLSHATQGGSDIGNSGLSALRVEKQLNAQAATKVGKLMRRAELAGHKEIIFQGSMNVSTYTVGNLDCYFQNSNDDVSCSTSEELNETASKTIGNLLRNSQIAGDQSVSFEGGPQVSIYAVGNVACYFQNSDDSVSCSVN